MRAPLFLVSVTLASLAAAPARAETAALQAQIDAAIADAFDAAKRGRPQADAALSRAAQALAERAVKSGPAEATGAETVAEELSRAGAWDPPPRVIAVRASPPERAATSIAARSDLASSPSTHYGLGLATDGRLAAAVLVFVERRAKLEPFPRTVSPGTSAVLRGQVVLPLYDARVFVTGPGGVARTSKPSGGPRNRFAAEVEFADPGRYTVEVVAESAKGPEVVAIFRVQSGKPRPEAARDEVVAERDDQRKAQAQVLAALNRRRRAAGLPALARSSLLDAIAAAHGAEMVKLNYFAHVSPKTGDVGDRLRAAGFRYLRAAENLGEAETALDAHRLIESSPGHLANVLDRDVDLVGIGTALVRRGTVENVVLVEVFARAQP